MKNSEYINYRLITQSLISRQLEQNKKIIKSMKVRLSYSPSGDLKMRQHKSSFEFFVANRVNGKSNSTYLKKSESKLLAQYLNKLYCEKLLTKLEAECDVLDNTLQVLKESNPSAVRLEIPSEFRDLVSTYAFDADEMMELWKQDSFQRNTYELDDKNVFRTNNRELVRSRAESIIANTVQGRGLVYKYEAALLLGDIVVYPDFIILHPKTCEEYYLEFFGMMNNYEYAEKCYRKIHNYEINGYGRNLIAIFESETNRFTQPLLDKILDEYFGPADG